MKLDILLLDDDFVSILISRKVLNTYFSQKFEICFFDFLKPEEALEFLEINRLEYSSRPLYIFLDINMPKIDGFDFLKILNDSYSRLNLRVFMLSSSISPEHKSLSFTFDCVIDYFVKPLSNDHLKNLENSLDFT